MSTTRRETGPLTFTDRDGFTLEVEADGRDGVTVKCADGSGTSVLVEMSREELREWLESLAEWVRDELPEQGT